ncbi:MAG: short-chain fatty acyl-CoA regulator family protein [Pseudomonadota bacterium]
MKAFLGTRLRERRRQQGVAQAELARRMGVSASYLNLIERNKRPIAGALLLRAAEALGVRAEELDGAPERRLIERLHEIAHMPGLAELALEAETAAEFVGRHPAWGRAIAALANSEREANLRASALSDRLSHDPFLGEAVHRMLSRISAIRSAAEILTDVTDLPPERRARFDAIIREEAQGLSDVGEALAAYFDKADAPTRAPLTPQDEVEALFDAREGRFGEIEAAVARLEPAAPAPGASRAEAARAQVAPALEPLLQAIVESRPEIETGAGAARARRALTAYAVAAALMPMEAFAERAEELRYDVEALAERFSAGVDAVCRRLTALPRREGAPRFGYLRANAAGAILELVALPELTAPRYAAGCPLWVLFRAQQSPEMLIRQRARFPNGARFVFVARSRHTGAAGFGKPRHYVTDMLTMSERDAAATIYAPDGATPTEEVGASCRLCPRAACPERVEDPLGA